ncbi:excisionase [Thomasclavelia ramosa]|uniref:excisionase n=1 Tax=Thomasclavelia ramosa TaxID=1547 RepID=UPI003450E024
MKKEVPISEKANLTLEEASAYFNIGINKIRTMTNDKNCKYIIWCGNKRLIKKKLFEEYLEKQYSI